MSTNRKLHQLSMLATNPPLAIDNGITRSRLLCFRLPLLTKIVRNADQAVHTRRSRVIFGHCRTYQARTIPDSLRLHP